MTASQSQAPVAAANFWRKYGLALAMILFISALHYLTPHGGTHDPATHAIEHFARGQLAMERIEVSDQAEVFDRPLKSLGLPAGFRMGTVFRKYRAIVPTGDTVLEPGDKVTLVGTTDVLEKVQPIFRRGQLRPRRVAIMGGSTISVWLTRLELR